MKIGYLMQEGVPDIRYFPLDGPANHVRQVINELASLGHQMRLLAKFNGKLWRSDDLEIFQPVSVRWLDQGLIRTFEKAIRRIQFELNLPYAAIFDSIRFAAACHQELAGFDLLYERMGWMGYGGGLAAQWLRIPLIQEINGDHISELEMLGIAPRGLQRWLSTCLMKKATEWASYIVASGGGWRKQFIERWKADPDKVTTIENGSELIDILERDQLRAFTTEEKEDTVTNIVYLGGFQPWQGIPILLRAFSQAYYQGANIRLVLIGSGSSLSEINQLIDELKINRRITLTGRLRSDEYAPYLAKADIGVAPYCGRFEFSGLKIIDYMAAGLATIASGENGQPAILTHGRTGWIIPPCNHDALCDAIIRLSNDKELTRQIGRAARLEAENKYSWQNTARQLEGIFYRALDSHRE